MLSRPRRPLFALLLSAAVLVSITIASSASRARGQEASPRAADAIGDRGDIVNLPAPLKNRIIELAGRHRTTDPMRAFAEADSPSQLFGYYLLDSIHFQKNVFNSINSLNSGMAPTAANCANHGDPTIGSVRLVVEPKPGLPTDPDDPEAFIDIFTDISGLFVINNEIGLVRRLDDPRPRACRTSPRRGRTGTPSSATMTSADADAIAAMGSRNNVPGRLFTVDGKPAHLPRADDHFPDKSDERRSGPAQHGRLQLRCSSPTPLVLGVQPVHQLGLPALRAAVHRRVPRRVLDRAAVALLTSVVPGSGPAADRSRPDPGRPAATIRGSTATARTIRAIPIAARRASSDDADCPQPPNEDHAERGCRLHSERPRERNPPATST